MEPLGFTYQVYLSDVFLDNLYINFLNNNVGKFSFLYVICLELNICFLIHTMKITKLLDRVVFLNLKKDYRLIRRVLIPLIVPHANVRLHS